MHLNISQQMKMGQQMKLAPRMIQSMEILQLPLQALEERIEEELGENVFLERETDNENVPDTELDQMRDQANNESNNPEIDDKEIVAGSEQNNESDFERLLEMAEQWPDDNVPSATKPSSNRISDDMDRSNDAIANITERQQTSTNIYSSSFTFLTARRK